jgi:hypothetical protein
MISENEVFRDFLILFIFLTQPMKFMKKYLYVLPLILIHMTSLNASILTEVIEFKDRDASGLPKLDVSFILLKSINLKTSPNEAIEFLKKNELDAKKIISNGKIFLFASKKIKFNSVGYDEFRVTIEISESNQIKSIAGSIFSHSL